MRVTVTALLIAFLFCGCYAASVNYQRLNNCDCSDDFEALEISLSCLPGKDDEFQSEPLRNTKSTQEWGIKSKGPYPLEFFANLQPIYNQRSLDGVTATNVPLNQASRPQYPQSTSGTSPQGNAWQPLPQAVSTGFQQPPQVPQQVPPQFMIGSPLREYRAQPNNPSPPQPFSDYYSPQSLANDTWNGLDEGGDAGGDEGGDAGGDMDMSDSCKPVCYVKQNSSPYATVFILC